MPVSSASSSPCPGVLAIHCHTHVQDSEHSETLDHSVSPGHVLGLSEPFILNELSTLQPQEVPCVLSQEKAILKVTHGF